jgi:uncharacterized delta-60 repeat protein
MRIGHIIPPKRRLADRPGDVAEQVSGGDVMTHARKDDQRENGLRFLILAVLFLLPLNLMAQQAGDLDTTFGVGGKVLTDISGDNDEGQDVALQPDGNIVVAGYSTIVGAGLVQFAVVRYLPDGSLDPGFGDDGVVLTSFGSINALAQTVALQPDGGIIAAGYTIDNSSVVSFALARYRPDGSLDTSFSGDGKLTLNVGFGQVNDLVLQPDARIVAIGTGGLVRFNADGTLDTTFGADGLVQVDFDQFAAVLQSDGKIVTAGTFLDVATGEREFALARFLSDGSPDTTFGTGGRVNTDVGGEGSGFAVTLQPNGKIVVAGGSLSPGENFTLARYLSDGTLDTTFGGDGLVTTDFGVVSQAFGVSLQADGKIVAAGVGGLARYLPDGTLDTTFSGDGIVTDFGGLGLVIQPDGRLVVAGSFSTTGNEGGFDIALARYLSGAASGAGPPTNKEQCKHNGWRAFTIPRTFRNEGDCIRFVTTGS